MTPRPPQEPVGAGDGCTHARIEVAWSNAAGPEEAFHLPYGCPILEQGRCAACGVTFERRGRIDGWGAWSAGE
jgi:hypothetical protein